MTNDTDADIRAEFEEMFSTHIESGSWRDNALFYYKAGIEQGKRIENMACAAICEQTMFNDGLVGLGLSHDDGCEECAESIRARINHDR